MMKKDTDPDGQSKAAFSEKAEKVAGRSDERGAQIISPSSITSAEAFGTIKINQTISPTGIPGGEMVGIPGGDAVLEKKKKKKKNTDSSLKFSKEDFRKMAFAVAQSLGEEGKDFNKKNVADRLNMSDTTLNKYLNNDSDLWSQLTSAFAESRAKNILTPSKKTSLP